MVRGGRLLLLSDSYFLSTIKEIGPHTLNSGVPLSQFYQRAFYGRAVAHFSAVAVTGKWALFDFQGNSIFFCNKQLIISVSLVYQINSTNLCNFNIYISDQMKMKEKTIWSPTVRFRGRVKLINCLFPWPFSLLSLLHYIYTAFCFVLF